MRIRQINIAQWRHFENIELRIDDDTGLVCIVGANGTGKSHLLELIAACAHHLGLSQGIEIPRGDPFSDPHELSLRFFLAEGISEVVEQGVAALEGFDQWDRTLMISSRKEEQGGVNVIIEAGGIEDDGRRRQFANQVVNHLRQTQDVHFLTLDADRAYPKKNIHANEVAQAYEIDWAGQEYMRGRSFKPSATLYDEWIKYFLAQENQSGNLLIADIRRARESCQPEPVFNDHFLAYKDALQRVLPHLMFAGVNSRGRTLLFDTTGLELNFNQLSSGEREIAFLIGQIDRFGLRQGLFLLDEPELHLNADLIRTWVGYLSGTVENGQVWLATHSLEAVEAAGQQATFVLERDEETRKVDTVARLDTRPLLSALSRAVGTPAFSISQLRFAFVEGEEALGERERFRKLSGVLQDVRFLECGSCNEVVRRVAAIGALAIEAEAGIRVGGIVDRDFRTDAQVAALRNDDGVYALDVHETENLFLHPDTLRILLAQHGRAEIDPVELIKDAADSRAGSWIFQHTMSTPRASDLPAIPSVAKDHAKTLTWNDFNRDQATAIQGILDLTRFGHDDSNRLRQILEISANAYGRKRAEDRLWEKCEGKQVLNRIAVGVGFSGAPALEQATFAAWKAEGAVIPEELLSFRAYIESL